MGLGNKKYTNDGLIVYFSELKIFEFKWPFLSLRVKVATLEEKIGYNLLILICHAIVVVCIYMHMRLLLFS